MKFPASLSLILALFGGLPGVIAAAVTAETKGKVDLTAAGIESDADRMATISEHDNALACAKLGIKDPGDVAHALDLARIAGDKVGDYAAFLAEKAAGIAPAS